MGLITDFVRQVVDSIYQKGNADQLLLRVDGGVYQEESVETNPKAWGRIQEAATIMLHGMCTTLLVTLKSFQAKTCMSIPPPCGPAIPQGAEDRRLNLLRGVV